MKSWIVLNRSADGVVLSIESQEGAKSHRMTHAEARRLCSALAPITVEDIMAAIARQPFNEGKVEQLFQRSQIEAGIREILQSGDRG